MIPNQKEKNQIPYHPQSHETPPDSAGYVQAWARDIVAAIGKAEARRLLDDYRAIAANQALDKSDRETAGERANAISRHL